MKQRTKFEVEIKTSQETIDGSKSATAFSFAHEIRRALVDNGFEMRRDSRGAVLVPQGSSSTSTLRERSS